MTLPEQITQLRKPKTKHKLISAITKRFSPRVFNSKTISNHDLITIFEAARLAPSGRNHQPWQYLWMRKGTKSYDKLFTCIPERNYWAQSAPLMIIAAYNPAEPIDGINKWA
ncbi:MAG: nitroreductase family protein [bacterium]